MKNKTKTIQNVITSLTKKRGIDQFYLSQSTIDNKTDEVGKSGSKLTFIVPWQMHNPIPEYLA